MPDAQDGFEAPDLDPTEAEFEPFDPRTLSTPDPSLAPQEDPSSSSETPVENGGGDEGGKDGAEPSDEAPLPEFDPRWRDEFEGLMFVGALKHTFKYLGHEFVIRTLTVDEILEIGLMTKPFQGSLGEVKAYQAAVVAACVVTVDGQRPPIPLTDEPSDTRVLARFNYVRRHWFPPVLDAIYQQYLTLETIVDQVIAAMEASLGNSLG